MKWEFDWLQRVQPSALTELNGVPGVRQVGNTGLVKIHRSMWPLLSEETRKQFPAPPEEHVIDVPDDALRPYQREAAKFCADRRGTLLALAMGCVEGDAVVRVNRGGMGRPYRLIEVYNKTHHVGCGYKTGGWDPTIPTYLRALCGDELRLHRMLDIAYVGVRPVVRLELASGKVLRLTPDHEVGLTDGSWCAVEALSPGVEVWTNGIPACEICGGLHTSWVPQRHVYKEQYARTLDKDGYIRVRCVNHPRAGKDRQVYEHILVMERFFGRHLFPNEQVHHVNGNRADNRVENLELVDVATHMRLHRVYRRLKGFAGKGGEVCFFPKPDKVASVRSDGKTVVFDVVMDSPYHNFVANGIVVHNCGKTRTALVAVGWGRGVIVSPLVAFKVWIKELQNAYGDLALWDPKSPTTWVDPQNNDPVDATTRAKIQIVRGHAKTGAQLVADADIYIVNPELLRTRGGNDLAAIRPDWVIFDEAHYYINPKAQRSQGASVLANCSPYIRNVALTGTPILKHLANLYGILGVINPGGWGGWRDWMFKYAGAQQGEHGVVLGDPSNVPELRSRLSEVMFARSWQEVAMTIPPITRERCVVTLSDEQREEYNRLAVDIREVLKALEKADLRGAESMQQVNMLRRLVGRAKVHSVQELIRSCGEPVVVWTWHRDVAEAIGKPYSDAVVVTGEESRKKRDEKIDLFKSGAANKFISTMSASGFAIDLTRARITIQAELSWTAADMSQAEARVFRSGQTQPCITYWLVADDTIEAHIVDALWGKAGMAAALGKSLEGDQQMMADVSGLQSRDTLRDKEIAKSILGMIQRSFDLAGRDD